MCACYLVCLHDDILRMHDGILCMHVGIHQMHADIGHVVHGLFSDCYRHVRNIVHVKFETDHPHRCWLQ